MEDETLAWSPLTPGERARVARALRNNWHIVGVREVAHALADKLEAEPDRPDDHAITGDVWDGLVRERDEAREALRERNAEVQRLHALMDDQPARMALAGLIDALGEEDPDDDLIREAVDRGIAALVGEGVERTHTLVPNHRSADVARVMQRFLASRGRSLPPSERDRIGALVREFSTAARGEDPEWPS